MLHRPARQPEARPSSLVDRNYALDAAACSGAIPSGHVLQQCQTLPTPNDSHLLTSCAGEPAADRALHDLNRVVINALHRPFKVAAVAYATKMARIIWAMLVTGECYRVRSAATPPRQKIAQPWIIDAARALTLQVRRGADYQQAPQRAVALLGDRARALAGWPPAMPRLRSRS
jgi:hypothetical protein